MAILSKDEIRKGLTVFITTQKQANTELTKLGAAAVYHAVTETDGTFVMEIFELIKKDLPKSAQPFKAWVMAKSPITWFVKEERLKYSEKQHKGRFADKTAADIHEDMLIEGFGIWTASEKTKQVDEVPFTKEVYEEELDKLEKRQKSAQKAKDKLDAKAEALGIPVKKEEVTENNMDWLSAIEYVMQIPNLTTEQLTVLANLHGQLKPKAA